MNLITCAEDCEYQKDGYCKLVAGAPVSAVRVNGCSYYKKRSEPAKPEKADNAGLRS